MTTGDGGMICSNNVKLIEPLKPYRWVGIDKDTWKRVQLSEKMRLMMPCIGTMIFLF